ncbi:hypothetical protein Bca52824_024288 [Brassica carinata]|uniref:Uncharacterized protein n=1 Tax=Brassica carinata TaxID=52824 RepID=A0A8X7VK52_BRACI|nr:hypothetical protein Bca52824_024288 [Brassica carinata]
MTILESLKRFHSLVSSPEIYARRSSLGCTEHCLYVSICNIDNRDDRLYTRISHHLVLIPGLPTLPHGRSVVAVGLRIYVFGEFNFHEWKSTSSAFSIDCRSHIVQPLPSIPFPMCDTLAGYMDGRLVDKGG